MIYRIGEYCSGPRIFPRSGIKEVNHASLTRAGLLQHWASIVFLKKSVTVFILPQGFKKLEYLVFPAVFLRLV